MLHNIRSLKCGMLNNDIMHVCIGIHLCVRVCAHLRSHRQQDIYILDIYLQTFCYNQILILTTKFGALTEASSINKSLSWVQNGTKQNNTKTTLEKKYIVREMHTLFKKGSVS